MSSAASVISSGSGSTAQAAGNGLPVYKQTYRSTKTNNNSNRNKMKLDMPPRPVKTSNRRQQQLSSSAGSSNAAGTTMNSKGGGSVSVGGSVTAMSAGTGSAAQGGGKGGADDAVPHVVRVTFLGVAGLLSKHQGGKNSALHQTNNSNGEGTSSLRPITAATTMSPASSDCQSLLFPLPPHLRVVASVSRSRTARGIPSGMSKCLASAAPPNNNHSDHHLSPPSKPPISPLTPATHTTAGSFSFSPTAGESHPPQSITSSKNSGKLSTDEISIERDASAGLEVFDEDPANNIGSRKEDSRTGRHSRKGSRSSISPPSQFMNSRTNNTHRSRTSQTSGGGSAGGSGSPSAGSGKDQTEGIEVIRPISPTNESGLLGGAKKMLGLSRSAKGEEENRGGDTAVGTTDGKDDEVEPDRYVAVWDEGGSFKPYREPKATTQQQQQQQKHQFVNLTNSLAFEAELRPSSIAEKDGRGTPVASTTFAPKSFCVSVGLVPNFDGESTSHKFDELEEMQSASSPMSQPPLEGSGGIPPLQPPTFAIPVGFADLVINGDETLDGKRKQVDLPLSSLGKFLASLPERVVEGTPPIPLIELTAEGLAGTMNSRHDPGARESGASSAAVSSTAATVKTTTTGKIKKKSIVKRMFSRKALLHNTSAAAASSDVRGEGARGGGRSPAASPPRVYDGASPRSIFQLGRAPNAAERTLFLDRFGVDPGGDAVVRIGLEVFPRGSELEKIFRQKNKLRKKAAAVAAASAAVGSRAAGGAGRRSPGPHMARERSSASNGRFSPSPSLGSRTHDTADSRSLMDDDDEYEELDSDCDDSVYSQSFFTLDSDTSRTTWDESTMYTDALSSYNTMDDDSLSYTTGFSEYERHKSVRGFKKGTSTTGLFFANLLNCNGPTSMACGVDEDDEDAPRRRTVKSIPSPYANIDTVAEAMASMSMASESVDESDTPRAHGAVAMKQSAQSIASMDTETRTNNRASSPDSIKESGEELTLDITGRSASVIAAESENVGGPPTSSLESSFTFEGAKSSITIQNETSPLATIKQRFAESQDFDGKDDSLQKGRRGQVEEGHEFTLEEHQSSM